MGELASKAEVTQFDIAITIEIEVAEFKAVLL